MEELQKKLEMSELLLQQFSSQSSAAGGNEQLQHAMEERAQLETHVSQLMESLKQLQVERDQYAENLKGESAMWQQRVQQMAEQLLDLSLQLLFRLGGPSWRLWRRWLLHLTPECGQAGLQLLTVLLPQQPRY